MRLVANWREAWRWLSIQFIALAALWESIPIEAKTVLFTAEGQGRVTMILLVLAALGRLKDQGSEQ